MITATEAAEQAEQAKKANDDRRFVGAMNEIYRAIEMGERSITFTLSAEDCQFAPHPWWKRLLGIDRRVVGLVPDSIPHRFAVELDRLGYKVLYGHTKYGKLAIQVEW